jgi:hypothetical protein
MACRAGIDRGHAVVPSFMLNVFRLRSVGASHSLIDGSMFPASHGYPRCQFRVRGISAILLAVRMNTTTPTDMLGRVSYFRNWPEAEAPDPARYFRSLGLTGRAPTRRQIAEDDPTEMRVSIVRSRRRDALCTGAHDRIWFCRVTSVDSIWVHKKTQIGAGHLR